MFVRRYPVSLVLALALAGLDGCAVSAPRNADSASPGGASPADTSKLPATGAPLAAPVVLKNDATAADTVEVTLSAGTKHFVLPDGREYDARVYNGSYPGPELDVTEGQHLIVHFRNDLKMETSVHWHGFHVPASQDNALEVEQPGATRDYRFDIPLNSAGTYWYHPHLHREVANQVGDGLFGSVHVRALADPLPASVGDNLVVFSDPAPGVAVSDMDRANGREGPTVLVNGQIRPSLELHPGEVRRLRMLNASASRYERLALPGGKMILVGSDGGALEKPYPLTELLLAPGERAEVLVSGVGQAGAHTALQALPYDRGVLAPGQMHGGHKGMAGAMKPGMQMASSPSASAMPMDKSHGMMDMDNMKMGASPAPVASKANNRTSSDSTASASGHLMGSAVQTAPIDLLVLNEAGPPAAAPVLPKTLRALPALDITHAIPRTITFTEEHMSLDFRLDGKRFDPKRVDIHAKLGTTEVWTLDNKGGMDHPFHLHGFDFQVLDRGGVREPYMAWKDTVNVRAKQKVRLALKFTDYPGLRVYHCHILDHEDLGMMGILEVK
jgi:FtsP/CotA-like multicopper oxidase with cupredoxin domain